MTDATYPRLTDLSDWPETSIEARHITEGAEVYHTGPAKDWGDGEMRHPVFVKPLGWDGPMPSDGASRSPPAAVTVYFLGPKNGPIKIGYASRLAFRLRDLRLANAYPIEVWATVEGPPCLERQYHRRFASARLHGEWFTRTPELEAEIARLVERSEAA